MTSHVDNGTRESASMKEGSGCRPAGQRGAEAPSWPKRLPPLRKAPVPSLRKTPMRAGLVRQGLWGGGQAAKSQTALPMKTGFRVALLQQLEVPACQQGPCLTPRPSHFHCMALSEWFFGGGGERDAAPGCQAVPCSLRSCGLRGSWAHRQGAVGQMDCNVG